MASGFDIRFQYVLVGWEGSASDATVLFSALNRGDNLAVPDGKFYLMDAGFLTPYRGVRYHLREFEECPPMNSQELFNLRHSSLRTTIEQVFGVVKNRFSILRMSHGYSLTTQRDIVIACCTLHNHIVMRSAGDPMLETISTGTNSRIDPPLTSTRNIETVPRWKRDTWHSFRDSIAEQMWNDYEH
ncbi:putative nuclease HARBI1 [Cinnamomum micranthum f. kanehirae]|uniref:Putative nuclease HARBI1 n=1 Tax=Cinnamomum micranthum f. kanehirae TaxID=337451 RepID=A0A3S3MY91_9MAGN|nr:putative nuclease HARBI1 [Cinnamomum micranthum f. kanehirae]